MTDAEFIEWAGREEARLAWILQARDYAKTHLQRQAELARVEREVSAAQQAFDELQVRIAARTDEADRALTRRLAVHEKEIARTIETGRREVERLGAEVDRVRAELAQATADCTAARQALDQFTAEAQATREQVQRQLTDLTAIRDGVRAQLAAALPRSPD